MVELIAVLSSGKGTWGQVSGLMKKGEWEKILILGPNYAKEFDVKDVRGQTIPFDFIEFDPSKSLVQLKKEFSKNLKEKIHGTEVALSIASGSGKEHMAIISALLSIPTGVRFTALTKDGIVML